MIEPLGEVILLEKIGEWTWRVLDIGSDVLDLVPGDVILTEHLMSMREDSGERCHFTRRQNVIAIVHPPSQDSTR